MVSDNRQSAVQPTALKGSRPMLGIDPGKAHMLEVIRPNQYLKLNQTPYPREIECNEVSFAALLTVGMITPFEIATQSGTKESGSALTLTLSLPAAAIDMYGLIPGVLVGFDVPDDVANAPITFNVVSKLAGYDSPRAGASPYKFDEDFEVEVARKGVMADLLIIPCNTVNGRHTPTHFFVRDASLLAEEDLYGTDAPAADVNKTQQSIVVSLADNEGPDGISMFATAMVLSNRKMRDLIMDYQRKAGWA
jgi:hypothetical protein